MINWNFPSNQDGQIKGVADAGIENFNGTELTSLARENCQNSLDAALDDNNPQVVVEFKLHYVKDRQIPGIDEYRRILRDCKSFWDTSKSEKAKQFLKDAVSHAEQKAGFVLQISDYNTSGLSDPYGNDEDLSDFSFDGWNALIKIDGGANKGDDKAGAFGIGKSAPFSNSYYRLVFYRTCNLENEHAAQGVSRLLSYPKKTQDGRKSMTSGVGYYGDPDRNDPVPSIPELDQLSKRTEIGTDVFVFGFKNSVDWEDRITAALVENFLMSFYRGQLQVKVQDRIINAETLGSYMYKVHERYPGETKGTYGNYLALVLDESSGVHTYSKEFHGLGSLELRILVDPNEKLDRKILIVRKAGMKLFRLGNISRLVPFTGILELKGKNLNSFFREMETVAHDNWEPGRHRKPKLAKAYYDEIKDWIREIVAELAENTSDEEIDVKGLGGVLQEEADYAGIESSKDEKTENLNDHLGQIDVLERPVKTPTKGFFYGQGDEGIQESEKVKGTLGSTGDPALRVLKGKRKRKKLQSHRGVPNPEGADIVSTNKNSGESSCPLKNVRIIKQGSGKFVVNFEIPHNVNHGRMELVAVGENGKVNRIRISNAETVAGCTAVKMNGDYIEAENMNSSERIKIKVSMADAHDYAMEVNLYEHN